MADALDSKSSMGNHVWVQLPPPVLLNDYYIRICNDELRAWFCNPSGYGVSLDTWVASITLVDCDQSDRHAESRHYHVFGHKAPVCTPLITVFAMMGTSLWRWRVRRRVLRRR